VVKSRRFTSGWSGVRFSPWVQYMFISKQNRGHHVCCDCLQPGCSYCDGDGSITRHRNEKLEKFMEQMTNTEKLSLNDIKKMLYKQNPVAHIKYVRKGHIYYNTSIDNEGTTQFINFEIPVSDMGDADFFPEMSGKLLIRWIILNNQ
jgi:hypothetical protein